MIIAAIIQARMGSTRLPGKILEDISGKSMLEHIIERVKLSKRINKVIIATSTEPEDDIVSTVVQSLDVKIFRGNKFDVLQRYYFAAKKYNVNYIVRICGDCPLIDPSTMDMVIDKHIKSNFDYTTNSTRTYPLGLDLEVLSFDILSKIYELAKEKKYLEQVTYYIEKNSEKFKIQYIKAKNNLKAPHLRLTVDTKEDLNLIRIIYDKLYNRIQIVDINEVIHLLSKEAKLLKINSHIIQKSKDDVDHRFT